MIRLALALALLTGCLSAESHPDSPDVSDDPPRRGAPMCPRADTVADSVCLPATYVPGDWIVPTVNADGWPCVRCKVPGTGLVPDACTVESTATYAREGKVACVADCGTCH